MTVLVATCFVQITAGLYMNVNQIRKIVPSDDGKALVFSVGSEQSSLDPDETPEQLMKRIQKTCNVQISSK